MSSLIVTICNNNFVKACLVMLSSLSKNLKDFHNYDLKILYENHICPLSEKNKIKIKNIVSHVIFEHVDNTAYHHFDARNDGAKASYLSLESFWQEEYDEVIFIDSDILILKDFSEILEYDYDIAACKAGIVEKVGKVSKIPYINTGFMVIRSNLINSETYNGLLNSAFKIRSKGIYSDQEALNLYFLGKNVNTYLLSFIYNWRQPDKFPITDDVKLIHYPGKMKPWKKKLNNKAFKLWNEEFKKIRNII